MIVCKNIVETLFNFHVFSEMNTIQIYKFTDPIRFKFKNPENNISSEIDLDTGIFNFDFKQDATRIESFLCCVLSIIQLAKMVNFQCEERKNKAFNANLPIINSEV